MVVELQWRLDVLSEALSNDWLAIFFRYNVGFWVKQMEGLVHWAYPGVWSSSGMFDFIFKGLRLTLASGAEVHRTLFGWKFRRPLFSCIF